MDAIEQFLIDQRKKAAKKLFELYGNYFGAGNTQYQIMGVDANGIQTDAKGYITVKDMATGKVTKAFDPLSVGLVTTTPPTTQSLNQNNPQNTGGTGGGFSPTTLLSGAGLVVPALGLFKGKGGGPAGPAQIAGLPGAQQSPFGPNPGGGGVGPGGVPIQSPTAGIPNIPGAQWNYVPVNALQPGQANPTVQTTRVEVPQPDGSISVSGQAVPGLNQPSYVTRITPDGIPYNQPLTAPGTTTTPWGKGSLLQGDLGSVIYNGQQLNTWQFTPNQYTPSFKILFSNDWKMNSQDISSINVIKPLPDGKYLVGLPDGSQIPIAPGESWLVTTGGSLRSSVKLDRIQSRISAFMPNQELLSPPSDINFAPTGSPPPLPNTIERILPPDVWPIKGANGLTYYQINDPSKFAYTGILNQSDPLYQYAYDYLKKSGTPINQLTDAKINQFIENEYLSIAKMPIPENIWNEARANVDATYKTMQEWRQYSPDAMLSPLPDPPTEKDYAIEAQRMVRQQMADAQKAVIIKGQRNEFLGSFAGAGIASWGLFQSIFGMTEGGKPTTGGVIGALGSMIGLATAMNYMHKALTNVIDGKTLSFFAKDTLNNLFSHGFLSHIPLLNHLHLGNVFQHMSGHAGTIGTIAAIVTFAILMGRKKDDEALAMEEFDQDVAPMVYSNGPVMLLTAGLSLASMGLNLNPSAPRMQEVMVPQIHFNTALAKATGGSLPADGQRYGTAFVQQGDPTRGTPTFVMYLTPGGVDAKGNLRDIAHVVQLKDGLKFGNPGSTGYIPFFVKDSGGKTIPNPMAVAAVGCQQQMLQCANDTNPADAQKCAQIAAACNKNAPPL